MILKESHQPPTTMKTLLSLTKQALTTAHFLANILDPKHQDKYLSGDEVDTAMAHFSERYPTCLPSVVNMRVQTGPFNQCMLQETLVVPVSSLTWWQSQVSHRNDDILLVCKSLLTAVAASAGVERVFSTFGLVQSKIRNRLGTEKAGTLVFMYKLLNNNKHCL